MQPDSELARLADLLDAAAAERKTLLYIDAAERLELPGPRRIQQLARLLEALTEADFAAGRPVRAALVVSKARPGLPAPGFFDCAARLDRKSTRLNSSHVAISYAVFCLKKKKRQDKTDQCWTG